MSEAAIKAFLDADYARLVSGLTLVTGSRALAEEAVSEAMARAWERMDRGLSIDSVPAWITTVAMNLSRSGTRKVWVELRARGRIQASAKTLAPGPSGDRIDVRRALAALPRRQREATVLRFYLDLSVQEIAGVMGISEGTTKSTLARARASLAVKLGEKEEMQEHV